MTADTCPKCDVDWTVVAMDAANLQARLDRGEIDLRTAWRMRRTGRRATIPGTVKGADFSLGVDGHVKGSGYPWYVDYRGAPDLLYARKASGFAPTMNAAKDAAEQAYHHLAHGP